MNPVFYKPLYGSDLKFWVHGEGGSALLPFQPRIQHVGPVISHPLPLSHASGSKSGRGLPHSKTLARRRQNAFTLIELLISVSVAAIILAAAYACLSAGFASQKMIEPRLDAAQNARVALALMSADLRCACPLSPDYDFFGAQRQIDGAEADNLDFGSRNFTPSRPGQGDFCQVSYYLDKDPATGGLTLWRRRNPSIALDAFSEGSREEIAHGLTSLQFEYYDGLDWYDTWGDTSPKARNRAVPEPNMTGLPNAVRITLAVNPEPRANKPPDLSSNSQPSLVFQTIVRLEMSDLFQSGGTSNAPASSGASGPPSS